MYVYNVTVNVEDTVAEEWLDWMKTEHIPQVMATGMFTDFHMFRIMDRQEDETGITFAIQYHCPTLGHYQRYQEEFAPGLQAETKRLYEGKVLAFRTLLERV